MRIIIDLQGAQTESRYRGIGRYTLSLAKAIIRNAGEHEVLLVLNGLLQESISSIRLEFANLLPSENIHVWHALGPVNESDANNQWRRESAELIREAFIQSLAPDVVHIPSFFEGYIDNAVTSIGLFDTCTPVSVTMLDLIPLLNQEQYLDPIPAYKAHYLRKIEQIKSAKKLFAISESARQEALEKLPFNTSDVIHQSIAIEPFFKQLNICKSEHSARRLALGISKPFVLYTGGADSRKNLPALIKAYSAIPECVRSKHQLVFAGRIPAGNIDELRIVAEKSGLPPEELYFTGYISDNQLVEIYNLCEVFVFPSWHEGFGLPVLEAMACGAPTLAANTSSLPEVICIEEALFCPFSIVDISNKIHLSLTDLDYKNRLKQNNLKQVKRFSWDTVAVKTIKSFEKMQKNKTIHNSESDGNINSKLIRQIELLDSTSVSAEERIKAIEIANKINYKPDCKTLFIDISELFQRDAATGIQRVTRSLLLELIKNPPEKYKIQPVYATTKSPGYYCANSYIKKNKVHNSTSFNKPDSPINYYSGDIFLGLDLQHQVLIAQKNTLRKMRNEGVYISFVVYDLLPILMPHTFPNGVKEIHQQWLTIIADMDHLLCISNAVANELSEWLRLQNHIPSPHAKISWFHLGADIENSMPSVGLPKQVEYILSQLNSRPSYLSVGTLEPRKGQSQILDAFNILWEKGFDANLVLVGKQGWHVDSLISRIKNHPKLDKQLFWLDSISDEFLDMIYLKSYCLIAASEGEGFGLPIIEAMKYNLNIIARDIPVFKEIANNTASYFNGFTGQNLADHLLEFKENHINKEKRSWLTWHESAQSILLLITEKQNSPEIIYKKIISELTFENNFLKTDNKKWKTLALENKSKFEFIEKSSSWRLTYPMRAIINIIKKIKNYNFQ